jgi:cyclic beta-1,2-glucan synthetase
VVAVEGEAVGALQWETDRGRFLDRGRGIRTPAVVIDGLAVDHRCGARSDREPAAAVRVPAGETVRVAFSTLVAPSRVAA